MKCSVCGSEMQGNICTVCDFQLFNVVGKMNDSLKAAHDKAAQEYKEDMLKNVKVYIKGYYWEEKNGDLVEKSRQDILVGKDIHTMEIGQEVWGDVVFARQTPQQSLKVTVIVQDKDKKEYTTTIVAPDTQDMWKVGFVLKPGFKGCLKVGAGNTFANSGEFSLKG